MRQSLPLFIVLALVFALALPVSALRPDLIATLHKDASGKLTMNQFMGAEEGLGKEILVEFSRRVGFDLDKAFRMAGVIAELDPDKRDAVLFLYGEFEAAKMIAELQKEIPQLKEESQGEYRRFVIKKGVVLIKDHMMLAAPGNAALLTDAASLKTVLGMIDALPSAQTVRLKVDLPEALRTKLLNRAGEKIPPPVLELLRGLNGLEFALQGAEMTLALTMKDGETAHGVKSMLDGFIAMGRMAMDGQEKSIRERMKDVSAFKLLSSDMLGKAHGIALGRKILDRLAFSARENQLVLRVELPEVLRDPKALLVGTAALGIGAAIAIPNFQKARSKAREKACYANMRVLEGAAEMYAMDKGDEKAPSLEELVEGGYLKKMPRCLQGGQYSIEMDEDGPQVECSIHGEIE